MMTHFPDTIWRHMASMSKQSIDMLVVVYQDRLQMTLRPCDKSGTRYIDWYMYNVVSSRPFVKTSFSPPRHSVMYLMWIKLSSQTAMKISKWRHSFFNDSTSRYFRVRVILQQETTQTCNLKFQVFWRRIHCSHIAPVVARNVAKNTITFH